MGLLKELENKLESLVDGMFADKFQTSVEPIELASHLKKLMVKNKKLSIENYYVPASYRIELSTEDFRQFAALGPKIIVELQNYLHESAKKEGFQPVSSINIDLQSNDDLGDGQFNVSITNDDNQDGGAPHEKTAIAFIHTDEGANIFPLFNEISTLGRSKDNDVYLPYEKISRKHARITIKDGGYLIEDLNSTNGVFVDDERVKEAHVPFGKKILVADLPIRLRR